MSVGVTQGFPEWPTSRPAGWPEYSGLAPGQLLLGPPTPVPTDGGGPDNTIVPGWELQEQTETASDAVAGRPGVWVGGRIPPNFAALSTVTATPATRWLPGMWVVLGDGSNVWWDGTSWRTGLSPPIITVPVTGATVSSPFTVSGVAPLGWFLTIYWNGDAVGNVSADNTTGAFSGQVTVDPGTGILTITDNDDEPVQITVT